MNIETASIKELTAIATQKQVANAERYASRKLAELSNPYNGARETLIAASLRRALNRAKK